MKSFIKILLLLLLHVFVEAQDSQKYSDSLHFALENVANDTIRMDICSNLGIYYEQKNRDSSLFYLEQGLAIAQKLKLKLNETLALDEKGYVLMTLGNYPKSLESLLQALKIAEDPASEKNTWNLEGRTSRNARLDLLGFIHLNMGHLYGATSNTAKQISNYFESISFAESVQDTYLQGLSTTLLGEAYLGVDKLDSALIFEQKALAFFHASGTNYWGGIIYNDISEIYLRKGNFKFAQVALFNSVQISEEVNNLYALGNAYLSLSHFYLLTNKQDSSLFFAKKGLGLSQRLNDPVLIANADSLLSSIYNEQNNRDSSFVYLKLATAIRDSLNFSERKHLLAYQNIGFDEQMRLKELEEEKIKMQTKIKTYAMLACIAVFILITFLLYKNNRNRKKTNDLLQDKNVEIEQQKKNLEQTLTELKSTQAQLIQSEKMASLGELTAGIAHEIQNPLNFVNNFSEVNKELVDELETELKNNNNKEAILIAKDIKENEEKISHHGKRADAIVKNMLQHSKQTSGAKEPTDINALCDEYLRLAYHGMRAKNKSFNAEFTTDFDHNIGKINIVPQDIGRVLLNLFNNAFYAVNEKSKLLADSYHPTVELKTRRINDTVEIIVSDNGPGILQKILDKIFQPFFTTKPTGEGTGLGLSLSYDIIKAHGGDIKVATEEGEGTEFIIQLPFQIAADED